MRKALLVGINTYPGAPLGGCVNDVLDMKEYLIKDRGWDESEINLLLNEKATKKRISNAVTNLFGDVKAGDLILFQFSGHGSQLPTRDRYNEIDGLDECECAYDFNFSRDTAIMDKEIGAYFSKLPAGISAYFLSDSCHAGDATRKIRIRPMASAQSIGAQNIRKPRAYPIPQGMIDDMITALQFDKTGFFKEEKFVGFWGFLKSFFVSSSGAPGSDTVSVGYISGCADSQTSADANIGGRPCGAFTHYFLENVRKFRDSPLSELASKIVDSLHKNGYAQTPQAEGAFKNRKFLAIE